MNQERIADTFFRALSRIEAPRLAKPLQPVLAYLRPFLNPVQYGWEYSRLGLDFDHSLRISWSDAALHTPRGMLFLVPTCVAYILGSHLHFARFTVPLFLIYNHYLVRPFVHVYRFAVDPMLAVFRHRFRPNPEHMRLTADAAGREAYFTQYHEPANFEPGPGEDGHDPDADAWER